MEIKNLIKIYDNVLPLVALSNFIKVINTLSFEDAKIIGNSSEGVVEKNIRRTKQKFLSQINNSITITHWHNLLYHYFHNMILKYSKDLNLIDFPISKIIDISILKYEGEGFYTWHVDHSAIIPRTISCILLLNNDYEGGNLCFRNPDGTEEWSVDVTANRMILWPSTFIYPHTVKPVTKGIRYSVVAWAL